MAAQINLKVTSNFDQAAKDIKQFGTITEAQAEKIRSFQESFKSERVDQFIDRQNRARAAITATRGPLEALKQEQNAYRREIERLIKAGLDPQDESVKKLRDRYSQLETEIEQANDAQKKSNSTFSIGIKSFTDLAVAGKVAIDALKRIYAIARDLEDAYFQQERAVNTLEAALRASGQEVERNSSSMQAFATDLQRVTTVGDEVSIGLMQVATSAGLTAKQAQQATKDAIGLSKAFGVSLESAIKATTNAQQGNYDLLNRYIPAVKNATGETEKASIAQKSLAQAFEVAKAQSKDALGTQEQLNNAWGDTKEILGAYASQGLTPVRRAFADLLTNLNSTISANRQLKNAIDAFREGGGIPGAMNIDELNVSLEDARKKLADLTKQQSLDMATGGARYQQEVDQVNEYIKALEKERTAKAELARWTAVQSAEEKRLLEIEAEKAEQARISREALDAYLDLVNAEYGKTQEGKIKSLEKEIALWEEYAKTAVNTAPQVQAILEEKKAALDAMKNKTGELVTEEQKRLQAALDAYSQEAKAQENYRNAEAALDALAEEYHQKELDRIEAERKAHIQKFTDMIGYATEILTAVDALFSASTEKRIAKIEKQLQAELEAAGLAEETKKEKLERELQEAFAAGDAQTIKEAQDALARFEIEDKYRKKIAQEEYKAALNIWKIQKAQAVAAAALAVAKALPNPWAAAAAGIAGGIQVAAVQESKPQPPTFQTGTMPSGFTVPESSSTRGDSIGFMAQPGETVSVSPRGEGGGQMITVNVVMNDQVLESQVQSLLDSNRLTFTNDNLRTA